MGLLGTSSSHTSLMGFDMTKDIKRLIKSLEAVIALFPEVTYVDMEEDTTVARARKLIRELRGKES